MSEVKKFSIKKLLLTILCSIIFTTFIGSTYLFISAIPNWIQGECLSAVTDVDGELIASTGKEIEEDLEKMIVERKNTYGEDFPVLGTYIYLTLLVYPCMSIIKMYLFTFVAGLILGTLIYIVFIQKAKGKKLISEIVIAFISIFLLIKLVNLGYQLVIDYTISNMTSEEFKYFTYLFDIRGDEMLLPFIAVFAIIYVCNLIYQRIQTNKLNKELNKSN